MTGDRDAILDSLRARLDALDPQDFRHREFYDDMLLEIGDYPISVREAAWELMHAQRERLLDELQRSNSTRMSSLSGWLIVATEGLSPISSDRVCDEINAHYDDIVARLIRDGETKFSASAAALKEMGDPVEINRHFRRSMITRFDQHLLVGLDHPQATKPDKAYLPVLLFTCISSLYFFVFGTTSSTFVTFTLFDFIMLVHIVTIFLWAGWTHSLLSGSLAKHGAFSRALRWRMVAQPVSLLGAILFFCRVFPPSGLNQDFMIFCLLLTFLIVGCGYYICAFERLARKLSTIAPHGVPGATL